MRMGQLYTMRTAMRHGNTPACGMGLLLGCGTVLAMGSCVVCRSECLPLSLRAAMCAG